MHRHAQATRKSARTHKRRRISFTRAISHDVEFGKEELVPFEGETLVDGVK